MELFDILTCDIDKQGGFDSIGEVYEPLNILTTPMRAVGTYTYNMAITWHYDRTNASAYFRFSLDGGLSWQEFTLEPQDSTDHGTLDYSFPKVVSSAEPLDLRVEAKKETGSGTMAVSHSDVWIQRVG